MKIIFGRTLKKLFWFFYFFCGVVKLICKLCHTFFTNLRPRQILILRPSALFKKNLRSAARKFADSAVCGNTYASPQNLVSILGMWIFLALYSNLSKLDATNYDRRRMKPIEYHHLHSYRSYSHRLRIFLLLPLLLQTIFQVLLRLRFPLLWPLFCWRNSSGFFSRCFFFSLPYFRFPCFLPLCVFGFSCDQCDFYERVGCDKL